MIAMTSSTAIFRNALRIRAWYDASSAFSASVGGFPDA